MRNDLSMSSILGCGNVMVNDTGLVHSLVERVKAEYEHSAIGLVGARADKPLVVKFTCNLDDSLLTDGDIDGAISLSELIDSQEDCVELTVKLKKYRSWSKLFQLINEHRWDLENRPLITVWEGGCFNFIRDSHVVNNFQVMVRDSRKHRAVNLFSGYCPNMAFWDVIRLMSVNLD